ncbi:hypothetical protein MNV49_001367 [Pseudohyphozyma bogoriensis]|nr:hypothetical protein MNV49_001367 [Pseudohyphozyma bogoriensis]
MAETHYDQNDLNTVKRYKHRAAYDRKTIFEIARAAPVLHCAFVSDDGLPQCIPMVGAVEEVKDGEAFVYLHGSSVSRFIKGNGEDAPMCITATLVDGFILSLTPYSHDVQYRTAIIHGRVFPFDESYDKDVEAAKMNALRLITNSAICDDRWENSRVPPTKTEMTATGILRIRIDTASAKCNAATPSDNATDMANEDLKKRVWTGVLPLKTVAGQPEPSEYNLLEGSSIPAHVRDFQQTWEKRMQAAVGAVPNQPTGATGFGPIRYDFPDERAQALTSESDPTPVIRDQWDPPQTPLSLSSSYISHHFLYYHPPAPLFAIAMSETHFEKNSLNKFGRHPERGTFDKAKVFSIFRAATVVHASFVSPDGLPQCIPMVGAIEEKPDGEVFVYFHGSSAGRFSKMNEPGNPMCITATVVDGLVMAVTSFNHSAQYRTAILHGTVYPFDESYDDDIEAEKLHALALMTDGATCETRWDNTRLPPTSAELTATGVVRVRIEGAAAKINAPQQPGVDKIDDNPETLNKVWTGVIPLRTVAMPPVPSDRNTIEMPEHIKNFAANFEKRVYGGAAPVNQAA